MTYIKSIKKEIIALLEVNELDKTLEMFNQYRDLLEKDLELYTMKATYYYLIGEINEAIEILNEGIKKNKFNYELNYNLAILYEEIGKHIEAYKYYIISSIIADEQINKSEATDHAIRIVNEIACKVEEQKDEKSNWSDQLKQINKEVKIYLLGGLDTFPKKSDSESYIGQFYDDKFFVGKYNYYFSERVTDISVGVADFTEYKIEMYNAYLTDKMEIESQEDCIIPIATKIRKNNIIVKNDKGEYVISPKEVDTYYYYSIKGPATLYSNRPFICGSPIKKTRNTRNKELVLNIFIDGLSQYILESMGLENLMPNTYKFFGKGTICNNAYVSGEWTYVGMASFFTGNYTTHHKMFHPNYVTKLPDDQKILSEIFKEQGYFTTKIDGDWRSIPIYGYARGIDRTLYQPTIIGMNLEEVIMELIEHIETFKDTNQFIWTCIGDLHDIADGFESRLLVQSQMNIKNRKVADEIKTTSVHVKHDEDKIERYKLQIKRIDMYLGMLFSYIENNFDDQNIVVSLVSDHGQSYLLKEGDAFLCDKRTKVPMMFRGGNVPKGECQELVQGLDLMPILCKLCGIPLQSEKLDCNLPTYFGREKQREYAYSESIFPGSTYKAAIHMAHQTFFYETVDKVKNDGRVSMDEYTLLLVDKEGNKKEIDEKFKEEMLEIINNHMAYNRIY